MRPSCLCGTISGMDVSPVRMVALLGILFALGGVAVMLECGDGCASGSESRVLAAASAVELSPDSAEVPPKGKTLLRLAAPSMTRCILSGGVYGGGQQTTVPSWVGTSGILSKSTTFFVSCTNAAGQSFSDSARVSVVEPTATTAPVATTPASQPVPSANSTTTTTSSAPPLSPTSPVRLASSKATVESGGSATLTLTTLNATFCMISGGWYGSGQQTTLPNWSGGTGTLTKTTTFTATCTVSGQSRAASVTIGITSSNTSPTTSPPVLSPPPSATTTQAAALITSAHRYDPPPPPTMFGGWGPHLGHLLRAPDGVLWFADDTGQNALTNAGTAYYRFDGTKWTRVATLPFYGNVQQNAGSIMRSNGVIYTYGIDTANDLLEECYFNTTNYAKRACNKVVSVGNNSNYVGAIVSPAGTRLVWWTNVVDNGAGTLSYVYNAGAGWKGPFSSSILGFNSAEYIRATFDGETRFVMVAQTVKGAAPNWTVGAMYGEGTLGKAISWKILSSGNAADPLIQPQDIWVDAGHGSHILTRAESGKIVYAYQPSGGSLQQAVATFGSCCWARFIDSGDGTLYIVYTDQYTKLASISIPKSGISGAIPVASFPAVVLDFGVDVGGSIYGIYPESRVYQTTPMRNGFNVAIVGEKEEGKVYHVAR